MADIFMQAGIKHKDGFIWYNNVQLTIFPYVAEWLTRPRQPSNRSKTALAGSGPTRGLVEALVKTPAGP